MVLAALGPRMLRLAAERTAGAHPYLVPVDYTRLAREILGPEPLLATEHKAVNLGQGFPDLDGPEAIRAAAAQVLMEGPNQYPPMQGVPELRRALSDHARHFYKLDYDWSDRGEMKPGYYAGMCKTFAVALIRYHNGDPAARIMAQAVTTEEFGPLAPKRMEMSPEAMLMMSIGMKNGDTRSSPLSRRTLWDSSSVLMPDTRVDWCSTSVSPLRLAIARLKAWTSFVSGPTRRAMLSSRHAKVRGLAS